MAAFFSEAQDLSELVGLFKASRVALTVADARSPDFPLVGVNSTFCDLSGYGANEVLDRNCRFLQPKSGAGPVRKRMRLFFTSPELDEEHFVIPNMRRNGEPFLNAVYMTKLSRGGEVVAILGSQFSLERRGVTDVDMYNRALRKDLRQLTSGADERDLLLMGSFSALSTGNALIAQARLHQG